jgi:predicted house-cleaning noncanonical NTP pyrophosphatase (MazG superfamily)
VTTQRFNKLVRDNITAIIEASGRKVVTRTLDDGEYATELRRKLTEEVQEFIESGTLEELADVLEVVLALASRLGADPHTLERARARKCLERGGFDKRIYLIEAITPE